MDGWMEKDASIHPHEYDDIDVDIFRWVDGMGIDGWMIWI